MDPKTYLDLIAKESDRRVDPEMDETTRSRVGTLPINHQRTTRILRTFTVSQFLRKKLAAIRERQVWMVLTEPWCGDSAQCVPILIRFAECNPQIEIRLVLRDRHPEIMERYLTNGTRGIPKLVAFNSAGEELFTWGPRPREGQALFEKGKAEGLTKAENLGRLHLWYARNRGAAIEADFALLLDALQERKPDLQVGER
jgi:Thioredoxin